jgi:hypothetical protein
MKIMADKIDKKEEIKTPETEQVPVSPDIKKEAEELLVKVDTDQKLDVLADDVLDPELKKVFDKIDGEQDAEDRQDQTFTEVQQLVQEKKYVDAASKIIGWLSGIFFKDAEKTGLDKYENLDDDVDFASWTMRNYKTISTTWMQRSIRRVTTIRNSNTRTSWA